MPLNFETTPIYASTDSRRSDGSVLDQGSGASNSNRWLLGLETAGGNTPGFHALLRFQTGATITNTPNLLTVVRGRLRVNASTRSTLGANYAWMAWASILSAPVVQGDQGKPYSNDSITPATLRIPLGTLFAAGGAISDPTVGEVAVANRFIHAGSGNVSDFEVRPYVPSGSLPLGANLTIYGADAGNGVSRPRLIGEAYTDAELQAQNTYRFLAVGAETYIAFQLENTPGRLMKGDILLDAKDSTLDANAANLESQALTKQRGRPRKTAPGAVQAGGDITFEVTPEKWTRMIPGVLRHIATQDVSGSYGGGNTGVMETFFRVGEIRDVKTFTFIKRRGAFRYVYQGAMLGNLSISADLDQLVQGKFALQTRDEYTYDQEAAGISDLNLLTGTAGFDSILNETLSFVGAQVSFGDYLGAVVDDRGLVQSFDINFNQGVTGRRGLNRRRAAFGHVAGGMRAEVTLRMELENELLARAYLGVTSRDFPYNAKIDVVFKRVQLRMMGSGGSGTPYLADKITPRQEVIVELPAMSFITVAKPVNGEGKIELNCTGVGNYDTTTQSISGTDQFGNIVTASVVENGTVMLTVRNTELYSHFASPAESLDNLITILPEGEAI